MIKLLIPTCLIIIHTICIGVSYEYIETLGNDIFYSKWDISTQNTTIIISGNTLLDSVYIESTSQGTQKWLNHRKHKSITINAQQITQNIHIHETNSNQNTSKIIFIENYPWLQAPGFQLKSFILSDQQKLKFVLLKLPKMTPILMEIAKVNEEPLTINGKTYNTIKTKMYPASFLRLFWKAPMWFDKQTGNILRYDGFISGPGSKKFVIEFSKEITTEP